jgi:squalene cyclase
MSDWMARDLHSALKVDRIGEAVGGSVRFLLVRLQYGKADIAYGLHANPQMFEIGLVQPANYLENLGFQVSDCAFFRGRCLVSEVTENL